MTAGPETAADASPGLNPGGAPERPLSAAFFTRSVHEVAPELIGVTLLVAGAGGVIVEVEAYDRDDPASHSFRGPTPRNRAMFGPPGHAYVYRCYGIHWCLNLVCGVPGPDGASPGEAVLVRALEPTSGLDRMAARRGLAAPADPRLLCAGPGRLAQALGVTGALDGRSLAEPPFTLLGAPPDPPASPDAPASLVACPRIGISAAADLSWRYLAAGSRFVSRPPRRA